MVRRGDGRNHRWHLRARGSTIALALCCALLADAARAQNADRYWDRNGTAAGRGGTGTWNTTPSIWSANNDGLSGPYGSWNNAGIDNAFFGGTPGTVTLSVPITVHNITFETDAYTLSGSTLTLSDVTPTITNNAGVSATINSIIAGTAGLTKAGAGTLTLNGVNSFSGGIAVNGGILNVNGNAALGAASNGIVMAGGTQLGSTGALAATRVVTLTSGSVTLTGAGVGAARFTGAGGIIALPGVTLSNNANDYIGQTRFNGANGTYSFSSIADLGVASSLGAPTTVADGTVLVTPTSGSPTLNYTGTGHSSNRNWAVQTVSGGGFRLRNAGSGTLTLTGNIAVTGTGAGTAIFEAAGSNLDLLGAISIAAPTKPASFTGSSGQTITLGGANTYGGTTSIANVTMRAPVLANAGIASSFGTGTGSTGAIGVSSNGTLNYIGAGASTNRPFTINNGTLSNNGSGALALSGTVAIANTATLGGSFSGAANGISGVISGSGNLVLNGAGTWIFAGNNSYSGGTAINSGNLVIGNGGTTGTAGSGNVAVNSAASTLSINRSNSLTFNGTLSGPGTLAQIGTGTTVLTAASSSIGAARISAGTLQVNGGLTTPTLTMTGTSTLTVNGTVQAAGATTPLLSGDAGVNRINVNGGGILRVNGDLAGGNDVVILAGTLDTGAALLSLGAGDDTLTLNNGGVISGMGIDAGTAGGADTLVINKTAAFTVGSGSIRGFERLTKQNAGVLTTTGSHMFSAGTQITGGTLDVDGSLETPTVTLANGTALIVDGTLQATGAAPTAITGSTGVNTVTVGAGGTLRATGSLGNGADVLDVAGTLDTGPGSFDLGAGNDTLTIHDGTTILGRVVAGAGTDIFNTSIALNADLGAVQGFETLRKTGVGVLNLNGPMSSDFTAVNVLAGTLNVAAGGSIVAVPGGTLATTVASGATLIVDGRYTAGAGNDTFNVSGIVRGLGTIALGNGNDVLTLNDGADLSALSSAIDGGGATTSDRVVLNNAAALTFHGGTTAGFELLTKQNTGTATMTGIHMFSAGTQITGGTLDVDGSLETPTVTLANGTVLVVDGTLQAAGATQATITGSTGANTVTVGAAGTLRATGSLGNGADTLDVAGTLDTGAGSFDLGGGNDTLTIHDGTTIRGRVVAGTGADTFNTDIAFSADLGAVQGFETLSKTGAGVLNINGPMSSDFTVVEVLAGTLNVAAGGSIVAAAGSTLDTTVASGATLTVDGSYTASADNDTFDVSGAVRGLGAIALGDGDDVLTLNDGADLSGYTGTLDGGAPPASDTLVLNNAVALTFGSGTIINFEHLSKQNTGTATLVGNHYYSIGTDIIGGTLDVDAILETPTVTLANDTGLAVDGTLQAAGATPAAITGSTGANTVTVGTAGRLRATGDLGDGVDLLDVAGTLDTGGGVFVLGAGDDTLTIRDGTNILGTVVAGTGADTFNTDIAFSADLGAVQGFETLSKTGVGVLNINGPMSSDFTVVEVLAGTLNVAAGGSIVAAAGSTLDTTVASGATLIVNGSYTTSASGDSFTLAGVVSGSGIVDLGDGDDRLTLNDGAVLNNMISGGAHGTGDLLILNNAAALSFDAGRTVNFETLTKQNTGAVTLTGSQSFSAGTQITGGMLNVVGALTTPTVDVAPVAVLAGSGRIMGNVNNAGTIAPGNATGAIGTLTVAGNVRFAPNSLYAADIAASGTGDLIAASGTALIDGGTIDVVAMDGNYTPGSRWTLVSAAGGRTGEFDGLTFTDLPFVNLILTYDSNHVYLESIRNNVTFCELARTANQCAAAVGFESTGLGTPVYDAIVRQIQDDGVRQALDAISGEIHATMRSAMLEDSRFVRDAVNDRLRSSFEGVAASAAPVMTYGGRGAQHAAASTDELAVWGQAFGSLGSFDGNGNAASFDRATGGLFLGADVLLGDAVRVGVFAGYGQSSVDVDARASTSKADTFHVGGFAGMKLARVGMRLGAAHAWHKIDARRSIAFPNFQETATASYDASTTQLFGELDYKVEIGQAAFEPFIALAHVEQEIDDLSETGGNAALHGVGRDQSATYSTAGFRAVTPLTPIGQTPVNLRATVGWQHAFDRVAPTVKFAFDRGDPFSIAGVPLARDLLAAETGLEGQLSERAKLGVSFSSRIGDGVQDHGLKAGLAIKF